jgi:hypothetical protein
MELMVADAEARMPKPSPTSAAPALPRPLHPTQEDPLRLQQARVRWPEVRALPDQPRRHRSRAGDRLSADSRRSPNSHPTASRSSSAPTRRQDRYEFNIFTAKWGK